MTKKQDKTNSQPSGQTGGQKAFGSVGMSEKGRERHDAQPDQGNPTEDARRNTSNAPKKIQSLAQLLREIYSDSKSRKRLTQDEIKAIKKSGFSEPADRSQLLVLAQQDLMLEHTKRLVIHNTTIDSIGINDFLKEVLIKHPAFSSLVANGLFDESGMLAEYGINSLESFDYGTLEFRSTSSPESVEALAAKSKANAIFCFVFYLWLWKVDTSLINLTERLNRYVWAENTSGLTDADKAGQLADPRDTKVASTILDIFKERLESLAYEKKIATSQAFKSDQRFQETRLLVDRREQQIAELVEKLNKLENEFTNYKVRSIDQYESLRGKVRGRLREDIKMLDDGLLALRRTSPHINVMLDHGERILDRLKKELNDLE